MAGGSEAQPPEELNRSFDGFEDEEDGGGDIGEMVSEGGRRRVFSKVLDKRNTEVYCFNFSRSLAKCGEHTVGRFYNGTVFGYLQYPRKLSFFTILGIDLRIIL